MSLSRRVATSVVDTLKNKGHILVVKGGNEALVRELDALMNAQLTQVSSAVGPRTVVGEVTSTFGDEAIDEAIEEMVGGLAERLMDSDHVEDVFAEDNVIRRDIFRAVRDTLLQIPEPDEAVEEEPAGPISVRLDTLGYVASTVAKRAEPLTLRDALERAALAFEGELKAYDDTGREATFAMPAGDPDVRLELEEAVADELTDLVDMGLVDLPSVERRLEAPRALSSTERAALKPKLDLAMQRAIQRQGFAASCDFVGGVTLVITLTPLSEQDAKSGDLYADAAAREATAVLIEAASATEQPAPSSKRPVLRAPEDRGAEAELVARAAAAGELPAMRRPLADEAIQPDAHADEEATRPVGDGAPASARDAARPSSRAGARATGAPSSRRGAAAATASATPTTAKRASKRAPAKPAAKKKASASEPAPSSRKARTSSRAEPAKPAKRTAARKKT
jgi:hypothetical protein